jgi:phage-related protein
MKQVVWLGNSREQIKGFPANVRKEAGRQLMRIQSGLDPTDCRPMRTIGMGVREIRIRYEGQYRIFYVASRDSTVFVLHAFQKKTQQTPKRDIDLARQRFKDVR